VPQKSRRYLSGGVIGAALVLTLAGGCGSDDSGGGKPAPKGVSVTVPAAQGGTVATPDGRLTLVIPPGALAQDTEIVVTPLKQGEIGTGWPAETTSVIAPYRLEPDGLAFGSSAAILFTLEETELPASSTDTAALVGIYTTSSTGSGELLSAGVIGEGPPSGKMQIAAPIDHFSDVGVLDLGSGSITGECKTCEVGGPYDGTVLAFGLKVPNDSNLTTTGPVVANWSGGWSVAFQGNERKFQYTCKAAGSGTISAELAWWKQVAGTSNWVGLFFPAQFKLAWQTVTASLECTGACSKANNDQCESDADCSAAESCHASCVCVCDKAKGAGCVSNADCPGSVCVTSTCQCGAPSCAFLPVSVGELANMLGISLDQAACLAVTIQNAVHSAASVPNKAVAHDFTTTEFFWHEVWVADTLGIDKAFNKSTFECGNGPNGYTLCPSPADPVPAGETLVLVNRVEKPIPLADSTNHFQYGFVFDADGDTTNNYQPSASYPNDFFKDTDRWYEADYDPTSGWTLKVSDATGGTPKQVTSHARIIIRDDTITLVVPASEFKVQKPKFRLTAFRHTGDYGINPPYNWDASVWPAVADGLQVQ